MTSSFAASCIHGFEPGQCAACRTCPHGLTTSRCGRCAGAEAAASRRRLPLAAVTPAPDEVRDGWEIFYVPALSGWQIRQPDTDAGPGSYRSLFLARKAVDEMIANPPAPKPSKRKA
jgi:hypothetical protein